MPTSRVSVDNSVTVAVAAVPDTYEGQVQVQLVNRGPNSVFVSDSTPVDPLTASFELASGDGFGKQLGRNEAVYGRCKSGETAIVHVFRDDID